MIAEHTHAVLTADLPEHGLRAGDVGTVVGILGEGAAYLIEFFTLNGDTIDVVYAEADQVRPAGGEEVAHARPLSSLRPEGK
jgi:hypothetical protein